MSVGRTPSEDVAVVDVEGSQPPPVGEEIHLPGPTLLPLVTGAAITLIVIGTTISIVLIIIGAIVLIVALFRWVSDTSRDVAALPEEHRH
jgi:membrane protein implicated in regulation of membrane protease activity